MDNEEEYDELEDGNIGDGTLGGIIFGQNNGLEDISEISFRSVHDDPVPFKNRSRKIFIPDTPITVRFVKYERNVTHHILNPYLYTIELEHGGFSWYIYKRYRHIQLLHQQLKLFRATLVLPFPTATHKSNRQSFKELKEKGNQEKGGSSLPRFPKRPEVMISYDQIEERMQQLEDYLNKLFNIKLYREHPDSVHFLLCSHVSFIQGLGMKGREGFVRKQTGSTRRGCDCCGILDNNVCLRCTHVCSDTCGSWRERWLFVKDTFLGYIRPRDGSIRGVLLFDQGFEISAGFYSSGMSNRFQVLNLQRRIVFKCRGTKKRQGWTDFIKEVCARQGYGFTQQNKNSSFAPPRSNCKACWFADGSAYMSHVADAIFNAKEEIFIADWWLSPEIYLKRPALHGYHWRLDSLLQMKALQGVKIFVLLYKEVELALGINSYYSKSKLSQLHSHNIKVLRHPDHANSGVFLWAHHEKIVCVDQNYAFLGGIDLCYGRWDNHEHRTRLCESVHWTSVLYISAVRLLSLLRLSLWPLRYVYLWGSAQDFLLLNWLADFGGFRRDFGRSPRKRFTSSRPSGNRYRPIATLAQDVNNIGLRTLTFESSEIPMEEASEEIDQEVEKELANVESVPEDANISSTSLQEHPAEPEIETVNEEHLKCDTPELESKSILNNVKNTFTGFCKKCSPCCQNEARKTDDDKHEEKIDVAVKVKPVECFSVHRTSDDIVIEPEDLSGVKFWVGKDYTNFIVKDFADLDSPFQDLVDRNTTPRMPWHDIGVMVQGAAARDVARHFIQRWNAVKVEKAKKINSIPYLLPKSYEHFEDNMPCAQYNVKCQVLRSISSWSGGYLDPDIWEESIHEAYITSIAKAQHYIYIENQFFISFARHNPYVKNQIGEAICKRIVKAYKEGKRFRVYVIIPLLPGFEGEVGAASGTALHAITHWNYASICRGNDSIMSRLQELGVENPNEFITFHGLRKHSEFLADHVTELIYVHSKLMIVDDRLVICGSANINDRSLLGKRDSEIAVLIEDEEYVPGRMDHEVTQVGSYASSLRKHLFSEHLGLLSPHKSEGDTNDEIDLTDPVCDEFYENVWLRISRDNTRIYEEVFRCVPSDRVTTFTDLELYQQEIPLLESDNAAAKNLIAQIKGHLVNLPLNFLMNANLVPTAKSVEGLMPTALWT